VRDSITDVPGIRVGHYTDRQGMTGCTVILCEDGAAGGVDIRGTATSTRQVDSLDPLHIVTEVHAVLFTGGSAFGLDAAAGVMDYLSERNTGFDTLYTRVPIVPAAVIFDISLADHKAKPTAADTYAACEAASEDFQEGSVGAGTGASVGKLFGIDQAMKGGLGTASVVLESGLAVGAIAAVNAFGDIRDPRTGKLVAGTRNAPDGTELVDTAAVISQAKVRVANAFEHTVIALVATNAKLTKAELCRVARMADAGLSRVVSPAHSAFDGDVVFSLSCGDVSSDTNTVGVLAAEALARAIFKGVVAADGMNLLPTATDLFPEASRR